MDRRTAPLVSLTLDLVKAPQYTRTLRRLEQVQGSGRTLIGGCRLWAESDWRMHGSGRTVIGGCSRILDGLWWEAEDEWLQVSGVTQHWFSMLFILAY